MSLQIKLATLAATLLTASNMCKELHNDLYGTPKAPEAAKPEPIRIPNPKANGKKFGHNKGKKFNPETGRMEYPAETDPVLAATSKQTVLARVSKAASKSH